MTVVEELDAAIARARGERVGVTDGPLVYEPETHSENGGMDTYHHVVADQGARYVGQVETAEDARHIAAWADPSVTDATVAVWQALRDEVAQRIDDDPMWGKALNDTETAVLAQVRAYMRGQS